MATEPVTGTEEQTEQEDQSFYEEMFAKFVQPMITEGKASLKSEELRIGAKSSPNRQELVGAFDALETESEEALLAYAKYSLATKKNPDPTDEDALEQVRSWVLRSINTTRKANARQKLINDAVPPEDKLAAQIARKLIAAGKFEDTDEGFQAAFDKAKAAFA